MAEVILRDKLAEADLADQVRVTSSGTGGWHVGDPADSRALEELAASVRQRTGGQVRPYLIAGPDVAVPPLVDLLVLQDARGAYAAAYGTAGAGTAAYLVRPDGHVGFRTRPVSEPALREHLAGVFTG